MSRKVHEDILGLDAEIAFTLFLILILLILGLM